MGIPHTLHAPVHYSITAHHPHHHPTPVYNEPAPVYHPAPTPVYKEPEYHPPPTPAYKEPEYHPAPAYKEPEPVYHPAPTPVYHPAPISVVAEGKCMPSELKYCPHGSWAHSGHVSIVHYPIIPAHPVHHAPESHNYPKSYQHVSAHYTVPAPSTYKGNNASLHSALKSGKKCNFSAPIIASKAKNLKFKKKQWLQGEACKHVLKVALFVHFLSSTVYLLFTHKGGSIMYVIVVMFMYQ